MADETTNESATLQEGTTTQEEETTETPAVAISQLKLSEELTLTDDFDLSSALLGNLVGCDVTDKEGNTTRHTGTLKALVSGSEQAQYGAAYILKDGDTELYFDRQGKCVSPEYNNSEVPEVKLKNVTATLPTFESNKVKTRASGDTATINAIRPIDQFAIAFITPILQRLQNPQEMAAADILKWCDVAYKWANGMFSIATTYRTANDSEVSTNSDSVKTAIDNAVKALNSITTEIKSKETKVTFPDVFKVDNPDNDKFDVEGAGGLSYDGLNDVGENVSSFPVFNDKAIGRSSLSDVVKVLAPLILKTDTALDWLRLDANKEADIWNNHASAIYEAVKSAVSDAIDDKIKAFANLNSLKTS